MTALDDGALPKNHFLGAKDYSHPPVKVIAHRRGYLSQLKGMHENQGKAIANLSTADSQGYMGYALDVVEAINQDITVLLSEIAKANTNAEQRYDDRAHAAAPAESKRNYPASMAEAISMRAEALAKDPSLASKIVDDIRAKTDD